MSDATAAGPDWPRLVGGDPVLDLANTRLADDGPAGDALASLESLGAWAAYAGPVGVGPASGGDPAPAEVLEHARSLRDAVLAIGAAAAAGRSPARHDLHALRDLYATAIREAEPALDPTLEWTWPRRSTAETAVHSLTVRAVQLFAETPPGRLKECGACGFLFLDSSKNRSRRWCSMLDCGTQEKMRRYTARRAAARTSGADGPGH